ncbi:lipase family protein [Peribacillus sp. NPDC006672]|uniref:lipase family protein n=1 Tax=Peribacillus sp. NPDC006672 TaxID=3390606 RepID=UPI003D075456
MGKVPDKVSHELSKVAYNIKPATYVDIRIGGKKQRWERVSNKDFVLHDKDTSFDAEVYKNGEDIVIAYRGTQGFKDIYTDINYIAFSNTPVHTGKHIDPDNQFKQAEQLVKDVKKQSPSKKIHLTGHSLGGALDPMQEPFTI